MQKHWPGWAVALCIFYCSVTVGFVTHCLTSLNIKFAKCHPDASAFGAFVDVGGSGSSAYAAVALPGRNFDDAPDCSSSAANACCHALAIAWVIAPLKAATASSELMQSCRGSVLA